ncbi:hypothetical protein BH23BAC4_BH23BAC4_00540 [soil metagenome]
MIETIEIRWFAEGHLPDTVLQWYATLGRLPEKEVRTDVYLIPLDPAEPGIKLREGALEIKRMRGFYEDEPFGSITAAAQEWAKWRIPTERDPSDNLTGWLNVKKERWVRTFEVDSHGQLSDADGQQVRNGATVELSSISADSRSWWSLCVEGFGESFDARIAAFEEVASHALKNAPAELEKAQQAGYPAWLEENFRSRAVQL